MVPTVILQTEGGSHNKTDRSKEYPSTSSPLVAVAGSDFVFTTEPLGFVLTKQVNDFLLRVQAVKGPVLNKQFV